MSEQSDIPLPEQIKRVEVYVDKNMNPVDDPKDATLKFVTTFDDDGNVESKYEVYIIDGIDPEKEEATEDLEFEQKHPRADDGEFTDKNGGSSSKLENMIEEFDDTRILDGYKTFTDVFCKDNNIEEKTFDLLYLNSPIANPEDKKYFNNALKTWNDILERNPKLNNNFQKLKKQVNEYNDELKQKFETKKTFFRVTSIDELDSYNRSGIIGGAFYSIHTQKITRTYSFVSLTMNIEDSVGRIGSGGVLIEYDGDDVRNTSHLVNYSADPIPFLSLRHQKSVGNIEKIDKPNSLMFAEEEEIRMPEGMKVNQDVKISAIHIDLTTIPEGLFRNRLGIPNPESDDFYKWLDYDLVKQKMIEKYGHLTNKIILHRTPLRNNESEEWLESE